MTAPTDEIIDLLAEVRRFSDTVKGLKRRRMHLTVALLVAVAVVAGLVGWIMFVQNPRTERVVHRTDRLAHRVEKNARTIQSVQCSLYRLVLTSGYHPETRIKPEDTLAEQRANLAVYNAQYKTIVHDNNRLGCVKAPEPTQYVTDPADATKGTP